MAVVKQLGKFVRSLIYLTMERYTNEELANMLLLYRECQKNQRQAAALYAERFFVWGYIRDQVYDSLPRNRNDVIQKIQTASEKITPMMLSKVRENLMRRIALFAEENGGHFEHVL
ncbi:hypothetical protein ALC57_10594 [Trachymyrmex cornetzi]|uniref:Mos1 transposase HTH domain-containing protein n=1 Tax=Trachymyrmex cornetzi TaxID=471704 RepID=A0A151J3W8_9HYME|nr:hypothetical protein ALC57_10594 [Trachymyrmex cornetzi]